MLLGADGLRWRSEASQLGERLELLRYASSVHRILWPDFGLGNVLEARRGVSKVLSEGNVVRKSRPQSSKSKWKKDTKAEK